VIVSPCVATQIEFTSPTREVTHDSRLRPSLLPVARGLLRRWCSLFVPTSHLPGASTSPPPFRTDAAPPWIFCFAYGRQSNYAAAHGGGADAPWEGARWFTVCSAARPTLRVLCAFSCRQATTTGESTATDALMFSPLVGGRDLM
jgi:hypothetical protein